MKDSTIVTHFSAIPDPRVTGRSKSAWTKPKYLESKLRGFVPTMKQLLSVSRVMPVAGSISSPEAGSGQRAFLQAVGVSIHSPASSLALHLKFSLQGLTVSCSGPQAVRRKKKRRKLQRTGGERIFTDHYHRVQDKREQRIQIVAIYRQKQASRLVRCCRSVYFTGLSPF